MTLLPTLLKAAGTGLGLLGQFGGADSSEAMADLNYTLDRFNATQDRQNTLLGLRLSAVRNRMELNAARTNLRLSVGDARIRQQNAQRLRLFAEAKTKQSREAMRRQMRRFEEFQSSQVAATAASGVQMSGSPLEVMAESAAQMRMNLEDMANQANMERSATLQDAAIEEIGARRDGMGARLSFGQARSGFRLNQTANRLGRMGAQTAFRRSIMSAEMARLSGYDQAAGQRLSAVGTIFNGAAGYFSDRYNIQQNGIV